MALSSGSKSDPHEIQSALGAGGMGEVYRARDTRLERARSRSKWSVSTGILEKGPTL